MAPPEHRSLFDPRFIGRDNELRWLEERVLRRNGSSAPIFVTGLGGVGKTSLLKQFLASHRLSRTPIWLDLYPHQDPQAAVTNFIEEMYNDKSAGPAIVIIDGAEDLSDQQLDFFSARLFNLKRVHTLLFSSRRTPKLKRAEILALDTLQPVDAERLFESLSGTELSPEAIAEAARVTQGHPLAVSLLAGILRSSGSEGFSDLLKGRLYDVSKAIAVPSTTLFSVVAPTIVVANETLLEQLKKQPQSIYDLSPRKFEELIAELLTDMGWDVELTPATRDGGKDILAYLNTDLGRLLCLVEAKKYRSDRKIGVDLVRTLYGTLCDHQANSAMLVTTSSFTSDAHEFQRRHNYQLALREVPSRTWLEFGVTAISGNMNVSLQAARSIC